MDALSRHLFKNFLDPFGGPASPSGATESSSRSGNPPGGPGDGDLEEELCLLAEASNGDLAFEVLFLDEAPLLVVDKVAHVVEVTVVLLEQPFSGVRDAAAAVSTTEVVEAAVTVDGVFEAAEPRFNSPPLLLLPPTPTLSVVEAEAPGTVKRPLVLLRERSLRLLEDVEVEGLILF